MGCRKQGTLPKPRLYKRGLLRLRMNGQVSRAAGRQMKDTKRYWRRGVLAVADCRMISKLNQIQKNKNIQPKVAFSRPAPNLCGRFTLYSIYRR